jgi:hypothetical protein
MVQCSCPHLKKYRHVGYNASNKSAILPFTGALEIVTVLETSLEERRMRTYALVFGVISISSLVSPAVADSFPTRRAGLWEATISLNGGGAPQVSKQCVDASTEESLRGLVGQGGPKGMCAVNTVEKVADGYKMHTECSIAGSSMVTDGSFTGDFEREYRGSLVSVMEPAMVGTGRTETTIHAVYKGDCPSDMKPGDISVNGGAVVNATESVAKAQEALEALKNNPELAKAMREMQRAAQGRR